MDIVTNMRVLNPSTFTGFWNRDLGNGRVKWKYVKLNFEELMWELEEEIEFELGRLNRYGVGARSSQVNTLR